MNRAGEAYEKAVESARIWTDWKWVVYFLAVFAWLVAPIIGWWARGFKVERTNDMIARHAMFRGVR